MKEYLNSFNFRLILLKIIEKFNYMFNYNNRYSVYVFIECLLRVGYGS